MAGYTIASVIQKDASEFSAESALALAFAAAEAMVTVASPSRLR